MNPSIPASVPPSRASLPEVVDPTPENLRRAAALLREGEVVGIPTETVYGLAGHAFDERALARIFAVKARPAFDPLILHLPRFPWPGVWDAEALDPPGREVVERLARAFWPGPLTLVLPRDARVPDLATSGLPTVGLRVPAHPVAQALLQEIGAPLAAPSANRFGRISPTRASDVAEELAGRIPLVLDGGEPTVGVESTIVAVRPGGVVELLRPGGTPVAALEARLGRAIVRPGGAAPSLGAGPRGTEGAMPAPGMLESHYAPGRRLELLPAGARPAPSLLAGEAPAALLLQGPATPAEAEARRRASGARRVRVLSPSGDEAEAARQLFRALRELDALPGPGVILAELAPRDEGLAHAINDRLRRAAAPRPPVSPPPDSSPPAPLVRPGHPAGEPPGSGHE